MVIKSVAIVFAPGLFDPVAAMEKRFDTYRAPKRSKAVQKAAEGVVLRSRPLRPFPKTTILSPGRDPTLSEKLRMHTDIQPIGEIPLI